MQITLPPTPAANLSYQRDAQAAVPEPVQSIAGQQQNPENRSASPLAQGSGLLPGLSGSDLLMQLVSARLRHSLSSHTNLTLELFCKFNLNS